MEGRCVANERRDDSDANEMEVMGEGNPMQTRACGEEGRWGCVWMGKGRSVDAWESRERMKGDGLGIRATWVSGM
jgi:hypothetical protein